MGKDRAGKGKHSGKKMATPEKQWPKNQIAYRDEAAQWLQLAINQMQENKPQDALFSMFTSLRWLEKAGAVSKPMSIETLKLFADFRTGK